MNALTEDILSNLSVEACGGYDAYCVWGLKYWMWKPY